MHEESWPSGRSTIGAVSDMPRGCRAVRHSLGQPGELPQRLGRADAGRRAGGALPPWFDLARIHWLAHLSQACLVEGADRLVDAAAGQPPGHSAGLGLIEVPAGCLFGLMVAPAERRKLTRTHH